MPRDNEAPGGTRSLHRVELAAKLAVRDASATKGGMLSNFYEERTPTITRIVKRPGVEPAGVVGSGCGGQGFTEFNGSLLTVACDTLYQQHMVGLHAIVTTSKYTPAEETGSNRYKLKFRPDQCGGEHVWNDPCDEDRESGEIEQERVFNLNLLGLRFPQPSGQDVYIFTPPSTINVKTTLPFVSGLPQASYAASGDTSYAIVTAAPVSGKLRIYSKAFAQLAETSQTGYTVVSVTYTAPYYYAMEVNGGLRKIFVYSENGTYQNISFDILGSKHVTNNSDKIATFDSTLIRIYTLTGTLETFWNAATTPLYIAISGNYVAVLTPEDVQPQHLLIYNITGTLLTNITLPNENDANTVHKWEALGVTTEGFYVASDAVYSAVFPTTYQYTIKRYTFAGNNDLTYSSGVVAEGNNKRTTFFTWDNP